MVDESNDAQYTFSRIEGDGRDTASIGEGNTDGSKPGYLPIENTHPGTTCYGTVCRKL